MMPRKAFTLVELLVVVSIIALLIAILLPALRGSKHETKRMICKSNMHQIAVGLMSYAADDDEFFPDAPWGRWEPSDIARTETEGHGNPGGGFYDHRDIMRSYTGAQLNDILKCPLADPWWFEAEGQSKRQDIDRYNMSAAPRVSSTYSFFYGRKSVDVNGDEKGWRRSKAMERIDERFSPKYSQYEFSILMSDYTKTVGFGGDRLLTTHQPIGGREGGGNMQAENRATIYYPGEQATANFALTDGSVTSYWFDFAAVASGDFTGMDRHLLPKDLGWK